MNQENKFWLICWIILGVIAISISLGSQHFYNQRIKHYVDNGYTQDTLPGESYCQWIKTK